MDLAFVGLGGPVGDVFARWWGLVAAVAGAVLLATVFAAVYHAEVIAHRIGEPFGTLVLALAVTVIETALIVSVMIAAPAEKAGLARDTVFAAVMIVCNGIVGACLLPAVPAITNRDFRSKARAPRWRCWPRSLALLWCFQTLQQPNLALCTAHRSSSSPELCRWCSTVLSFSSKRCGTAIIFFRCKVTTSTHMRHRRPTGCCSERRSASRLPGRHCWACQSSDATVEYGVAQLAVPKAVVGVVIAALVLLPEALAALRTARGNRLQTSLNLALGSALATIGLTIPAVAGVSIVLGQPLELGLGGKDQALLALTLLLSVITLGTGRTTVLQGIVHLVFFATFLFFAVVP